MLIYLFGYKENWRKSCKWILGKRQNSNHGNHGVSNIMLIISDDSIWYLLPFNLYFSKYFNQFRNMYYIVHIIGFNELCNWIENVAIKHIIL